MRKINSAGLNLVREFEGLRLVAYDDLAPTKVLQPGDTIRGTLTIGYGRTRGVKIGDRCTEAQAVAWLREDLGDAEAAVSRLVTVDMNDNEFAALVSLVFNIGAGNFNKSTLLRKLNAGDREGAAEQFAVWNKAKGKVLAGLTRRRAAEKALFLRKPEAKPAKSKKRTMSEWALTAAPALGAAFADWGWQAILAAGAVGLAGFFLWRWLERRRAP